MSPLSTADLPARLLVAGVDLPPIEYALAAVVLGGAATALAFVVAERFELGTPAEETPGDWEDDIIPESNTDSGAEEAAREQTGVESPSIESLSEVQQTQLAPENLIEDPDNYTYIRTGKDTYIRSFFVSGWPDAMGDGQLQELFAQAGYVVDGGLWSDPVDSKLARDRLKGKIEELQADVQLARSDGNTVEAEDIETELRQYRGMRNTIRDTSAELFDTAMYFSVVAESESQLDRRCTEIDDILISNGFEITPFRKRQQETHRSVSPILTDEVGQQQAMMSAAIGGLMPWSSGTLIQESGVPIGEHAENGSPIIYDRFEHDRGYNWLTIGNIGAGKSFSTKLHFLRRRMYDPDTIIVMLDPLEGFAGLASALDSRHVMVGGRTGLNPLEIKRVPQEILDTNPELDPGKAKLKDLKSFFESFFQLRDEQLGERWDTLSRAIKLAYEEVGISLDDPSTHDRPNPTIQDHLVPILLDMIVNEEDNSILNDIVDDGDNHDLGDVFEQAKQVTDRERKRAIDLLLSMEAFLEGNALSNLGGKSDFQMGDESSLYIDLQQQEGRGSLGLMMNLLFSSVYERAKQTDKKVIFAIDEARYIMRDKSALEFLEQAVRHSRHYDLSIQFITQTVDEFFQHPESEAIADQCDHKLFFHTEGVDETVADKVGMNEIQARFVRNATPGDEETGYSEACFQVADDGWYPVHIRAMDREAAIVDLDPTTDIEEALPGMHDEDELPARVKQLREYLQSQRAASVTEQRQQQTASPAVPEREVPVGDDDVQKRVDREALNAATTSIEDVLVSHIDADIDAVAGNEPPASNDDTPPEEAPDQPPAENQSRHTDDADRPPETVSWAGLTSEAVEATLYEHGIYTADAVLDEVATLHSIDAVESDAIDTLIEFATAATGRDPPQSQNGSAPTNTPDNEPAGDTTDQEGSDG